MTQVTEGHLGGYVPGGDDATFFPELWKWLVDELGVKSVIDVGCGDGQAMDVFREHGCEVMGVEGVAQDAPDIYQHDYTKGPFIPGGRFDLCWSCEFVEHVEERYTRDFLATFERANLVLMTHASPGQMGYHHVNCQTADYWVGAMAGLGYGLDHPLTAKTRSLARLNANPWNHYVRSGLAFRRFGPELSFRKFG